MMVSKPREVTKAMQAEEYPFYAILGESSYLKKQYYEKLIVVLNIPVEDDFNVQFFTGQDVNLASLMEACEMMPLFAPRKFVILKDANLYKWTADRFKELVEIIENLPEETILILADLSDSLENTGQKKKTQKTLEKYGLLIEANEPSEKELVQWVARQCDKRGVRVTQKAAEKLVVYCGGEMNRILTELEKLASFSSDITEESVKLLVTPTLDVSVFALTKAVEKGNVGEALLVLRDLESFGEEAIVVLGVLASQYVTLFRAMAALEEGIPVEEVVSDFSYRGRDFVVRNAMRQAGRSTWKIMTQTIGLLEEADLLLKTGAPRTYLVLEATIVKLIRLNMGRKSA